MTTVQIENQINDLLAKAKTFSSPGASRQMLAHSSALLAEVSTLRAKLPQKAETRTAERNDLEMRSYLYEHRSAFDTASAASLVAQQFAGLYRTHLQSTEAWQRAGSTVYQTGKGAPYMLPVLADQSQTGIVLVEGTQSSVVLPAFENVAFGQGIAYSSNAVTASSEFIQDLTVPFVPLLASVLATRVAKVTGLAWSTGTVTNGDASLLAAMTVGLTSAAPTTTPTIVELCNFIATVPVQYLASENQPCWMMHPSIKAIFAQTLSTLSGEQLYPSVTAENKLLGYEIVANQDMASSFASNSLTLAFGSFQQAVVIRQADPILISDFESRAEFSQVLYNLLHRQSAKLVNSDATRILKQHA